MKNPSKYIGKEREYLEKVLKSENWSSTSGNWTSSLEHQFARKFKAKYAIAFNSGTSTLHSALLAGGISPGDEVISPALTCIMNTSSTIHANAVPVYADISPETFTIDPLDIEKKINHKTKAIVVVATYGLPCDMDRIVELANKYKLFLLEDNAQCFLSKYKNRLTGTIGQMGSYSFEESKHISCGEGGMLITNDEELALKARKIGNHGFINLKSDSGKVKTDINLFQNPDYKRHDLIGWNYRLPEFNSAIALAQLERLDEFIDYRIKTAEIFIDAMNECDYLLPQITPNSSTNSYWALAVRYEGESSIGLTWEDFRSEYIKAGGDGFYGAWSVPYLEPVMEKRHFVNLNPSIYSDIYYGKGSCPVAEELQKKLMIFKTNYRSMDLAHKKAKILKR